MKKILLLQIVAFLVLSSFAQTQPGSHLTFKGVPIDGTLNEFISNMKEQGFTLVAIEDGISMLQGDFASYKDCYLGVKTTDQKDLVDKICIFFPRQDNWSSLSSDYFSLKQMLTEKYGAPAKCVEIFKTDREPSDDGERMNEVKQDRCKYYTRFDTDQGSIYLSIEQLYLEDCFAYISYHDKINGEIIKGKAMEDL